jgi:hypothetical protein
MNDIELKLSALEAPFLIQQAHVEKSKQQVQEIHTNVETNKYLMSKMQQELDEFREHMVQKEDYALFKTTAYGRIDSSSVEIRETMQQLNQTDKYIHKHLPFKVQNQIYQALKAQQNGYTV